MVSRTSIEEANKHLVALHRRVEELEKVVRDQHEALAAKDSYLQARVAALSQRDREVQELRSRLYSSDHHNSQLEARNAEQEKTIKSLTKESSVLKNIVKLIPNVKELLQHMEEAVSIQSQSCVQNGDNNSMVINNDTGYETEVQVHNPGENEISELNGPTESVSSTTEMARGFVKHHREKHFSITEDEDIEEDMTEQKKDTDIFRELRLSKEFYL